MPLSGAERQRRFIARLKARPPFGPDTPDDEIARFLYEHLDHEKVRRVMITYIRLVDEAEAAARAVKRASRKRKRKR